MPELPTASTVPPVIVNVPSLSSGEFAPELVEKTSTVPPAMFSDPLESIPSPVSAST